MSKAIFTRQELQLYRKQLQTLIDRLTGKVSDLEAEALRSATGPTGNPDAVAAHDADPATRDSEDRVALALLDSEEQVLAEASAALARIDLGTFGRCERCEHAIGKTRLNALPYVRHCIECTRTTEA
jgi:DnaK suppressor protein